MSTDKDKSNGNAQPQAKESYAQGANGNNRADLGTEQVNLLQRNTMDTPIPNGGDEASTKCKDKNANRKIQKRFHEIQHGVEIVADRTKVECGKYWRDFFSVDHLKRRLPIINWLPEYRLSKLKCDVIAGLTVGLTVIPQGMAYADLAGLDLQVSTTSCFVCVHFSLLMRLA